MVVNFYQVTNFLCNAKSALHKMTQLSVIMEIDTYRSNGSGTFFPTYIDKTLMQLNHCKHLNVLH